MLVVGLAAISPTSLCAEERLALIVGNQDYTSAPLRNPGNDAGLMAETLGGLGFDVTLLTNLDQKGLKRAISEFGLKLDAAGEDSIGLFYYSGHGLQADGQNYLIPVGAVIRHAMDIDIEAVRAQTVLDVMAAAGNRLNFVILDACRDNPYASAFKSLSRGLAGMPATSGTLVAYATAPGQVAADGVGMFSPYTEALSDVLETGAQPAEGVFREVRTRVMAETDGLQVPWETSSLVGAPFYFGARPEQPEPLQAEVSELADLTTEAGTPQGNQPDPDVLVWEGIKDSNHVVDFETFVENFPESPFAPFARARIAAQQEAGARSMGTRQAGVETMTATFVATEAAVLRSAPSTVATKLGSLIKGTAVTVTGKLRQGNWYRVAHPEGGPAYVFGDLLSPISAAELALWDKIKDSDSAATFDAYLQAFPRGIFAESARRLATALKGAPRVAAAPSQPPAMSRSLAPGFPVGKIFRDCPVCPELVVIPPGSVAGQGHDADELTLHHALAVGRYEVTFEQWDACVADGGCAGRKLGDEGWGRGQRPVINVSWADAGAYIAWLRRKTGKGYRLLTEAEWEYAARAGTRTPFHFGEVVTTAQANFHGTSNGEKELAEAFRRQTLPVGEFVPNDFGLFDVHGNVWEMTDGCNLAMVGGPGGSSDTSTDRGCYARVLRGGGWDSGPDMLRSDFRGTESAALRSATGFRLARTLP